LTGLQLPIVYPSRFSQTPDRQLGPIPDGRLQSMGTTDESGHVELLLPSPESVASFEAEVEENVFVTWTVASSTVAVPKTWSETLKVPELRRLPIRVSTVGDDLVDLRITASTIPLTSYGATTGTRHYIQLDDAGLGTAVIQNEAILMLRNRNKKSTERFLSQGWIQSSASLEKIDVAFDKGVSVSGRVVASDGKPAPDVSLFSMTQGESIVLSTNADGRFEFSAPAGQMMLVPAENSGYRARELTEQSALTIPSGKPSHYVGDITLIRFKSLKGLVKDESGNAVPSATVRATWNEPDPRTPQVVIERDEQVTTNADGEFAIVEIEPDAEVSLTADHDGAVTDRIRTVPAGQLDQVATLSISHAAAISVSGRITDGDGSGISGLSVTLRHRLKSPVINAEAPIGEDVACVTLVTDTDGRYTTPKTLPPWGEYIAVIRPATSREADSGWKAAKSGEPLVLPPIEESRTGKILGRVATVDGKPIAGSRVVVLTSEGQSEVASNADGTFTIDRPAGRAPLLIANADGRMSNGVALELSSQPLEIVLPEPDELPLKSAVALSESSQTATNWTPEQKRELALKLVDGLHNADPQMQMQFDAAIARAFPDRIMEKLESLPAANTQPGQMIRGSLAMGLAIDRPQEALRILDELPDGVMKLMMMVQFESVVQLDEDARLQLLARIVQDARGINEAQYRVITLGFAAERLLDRGQRESGELLLRETLEDAKNLAPAAWSAYARGAFAEELAQVDADVALELIEPITDVFEFNRHLQNIAHELATIDPDRAIAILDNFRAPDANRKPIVDERDGAAVRVCYRMIRIAPTKAIELARTIKHDSMRVYAFSVMIESLLRDDSGDARAQALRLHDEAWQMLTDTNKDADLSEVAWLYPSTMAAALCKHTAELAPNQLPHRIWQTIALRRPMEKSGAYTLAGKGCCCEMALLLARVDRNQAHRVARWLPSPSDGGSHFATYVSSARPAASLIAELQPQQCEAALDAVTDEASKDRLRLGLVKALTRTGDAQDRAVRQNMILWFPDDEDHGPID